jgi:hypothetical protein
VALGASQVEDKTEGGEGTVLTCVGCMQNLPIL